MTAWRARAGDRLPLFFLAWFAILIAPVLPLSDHLSEYYPFLPSIGLAMWGGWALALACAPDAALEGGGSSPGADLSRVLR